MNPVAEKQLIRQHIITQREKLSADMRAALSVAITDRLLQMPEYQKAQTVLGYMNFGSEYACESWVEHALRDGKRLALPRVNHHTNRLDLYFVEDPENQLAAGMWGIREPMVERCNKPVSINEVEFALLPGVAFTRMGARLGYGGGYYDKLLANMVHGAALVAGAFSLQIVEQLPQQATDIKIEWVVTEQESIACPVHIFQGFPV